MEMALHRQYLERIEMLLAMKAEGKMVDGTAMKLAGEKMKYGDYQMAEFYIKKAILID